MPRLVAIIIMQNAKISNAGMICAGRSEGGTGAISCHAYIYDSGPTPETGWPKGDWQGA